MGKGWYLYVKKKYVTFQVGENLTLESEPSLYQLSVNKVQLRTA